MRGLSKVVVLLLLALVVMPIWPPEAKEVELKTRGGGTLMDSNFITTKDNNYSYGYHNNSIYLSVVNGYNYSINLTFEKFTPNNWLLENFPDNLTIPPNSNENISLSLFIPSTACVNNKFKIAYNYYYSSNGSKWSLGGADLLNINLLTPDYTVINDYTKINWDEGKNIEIHSIFLNHGKLNAENVTALLFVDNDLIDTYLISRMEINKSYERTTNWTATAGEHTLRVMVDPDNETWEYNEDDNELVYTFTVEEKPVLTYWIAGLVLGIAAGLVVLLVYLKKVGLKKPDK